MSLLSQVSCTELRKEELPASAEEIAVLHPCVPAWSIVEEQGMKKLRNAYRFDDEKTAGVFVRLVEELARKENHPAAIAREGPAVTVSWWTPVLSGIHPNDFIMAAKTDGAYTLALVGSQGDMFTEEPLPKLTDLPRFRQAFAGRFPVKEKGAG